MYIISIYEFIKGKNYLFLYIYMYKLIFFLFRKYNIVVFDKLNILKMFIKKNVVLFCVYNNYFNEIGDVYIIVFFVIGVFGV